MRYRSPLLSPGPAPTAHTALMEGQDKVDVIIYRVREQGLEVFLVNPQTTEQHQACWQTPSADHADSERLRMQAIELDPVTGENGFSRKAIAIEADWHDIPSLRALIYEDYRVAKEKAKQKIRDFIPDMEKGAYVAVKEAFKRVLPEQYAFIKELKDILSEKNQTKYI